MSIRRPLLRFCCGILCLALVSIAPPPAIASETDAQKPAEVLGEQFVRYLDGVSDTFMLQLNTLVRGGDRERLWGPVNLERQVAIEEFTVFFGRSGSARRLFDPFVIRVETDFPVLTITHSRARTAQEQAGVRFRPATPQRRVYLHGFDGPGMVVLLPRLRRQERRPAALALCPRFPASEVAAAEREHTYYLEDGQSSLLSVGATARGVAEHRFLSGFGEGVATLALEALGLTAAPRVPELSVRMKDPLLQLLYEPDSLPLSPLDLEEGAYLVSDRAGLRFLATQQTAVGERRTISFEHSVILEEISLPEDIGVDYSGTTVGLGAGACYLAQFHEELLVEYFPRAEGGTDDDNH